MADSSNPLCSTLQSSGPRTFQRINRNMRVCAGFAIARYSRNPMYVGVLTGVAVALCFYSFVIFYEEPILSKRFGSDYDQYCTEVARWLFR